MKIYKQSTKSWYLERIIFLLAGVFVVSSVILGLLWSAGFLYFTIFVGSVMILFALTGYCPMAMLLNKIGVKEK